MKLVIAEKPSVARELALHVQGTKQQGEGYIKRGQYVFTWAIGHLLSLQDPEHYHQEWKKWDMTTLPILPQKFEIKPANTNARKQLSLIRKVSKLENWETVINACDAGREGELIFAWIYQHLKLKSPVERLWLSSLTKDSILKGFESIQPGKKYERLEQAARLRAEADWLVGLNATRAASLRLRGAFSGKQVLSLGRVQTPTLALIVKREHQINNFVPEKYWQVKALFASQKGKYSGVLLNPEDNKQDRVWKEDIAKAVENVKGKEGKIISLNTKEVKEQPPYLFDLTSLQRECNNKFGFSATRTLQSAQRLYEAHKMLTYPRVDSKFLSQDVAKTIPDILNKLQAFHALQEFTQIEPNITKRIVDDEKVTDHHAIIPTGIIKNDLEGDDAKVFDLVARRFVATLYPAALVKQTSLKTQVEEYIFKTSGRMILKLGWRALYLKEQEENILPELEKGLTVQTEEIDVQEKETKPPGHYSDASLLGAMETAGKEVEDEELKEILKESGLGTPATRASIIETLITREYIQRQGKQLVPTEKGVKLIDVIIQQPICSPELTGHWEKQLNLIAQNKGEAQEFDQGIRDFTKQIVQDLEKISLQDVPRLELGACPGCNKPIRENRKGFSCWSKEDPGCGFVIWKNTLGHTFTEEELKVLVSQETTEPLLFGTGKEKVSSRAKMQKDSQGKWQLYLLDAPELVQEKKKEPVADCPRCKKSIWENRKGFSCWSSPKQPGCGFVIWKQQKAFELDKEGFIQLLKQHKTQIINPQNQETKMLEIIEEDDKLFSHIEGEDKKEIPVRKPKK